MQITLLGTGNPIPDPLRAGPATLVRAGSDALLVDAGRGVLMRLAAVGLFPPALSAVLLTHLHSDHITDLNDVITGHWVMSPEPTTLRIYGPPRTAEVVDATLAMLAPDISYRLAHHADLTGPPLVEVIEVAPGDTFAVGGTQVLVGRTDHRPVEPSIAFRVDHDGTSVVLAGDGVPCDDLDELCRGTGAYVQTVLRDDLVKLVPSARFQEILDYHSSVADAARTAARAGVGKLILTHYIPGPPTAQLDLWRALAAEHFDGEIVVGDDGHTVDA
jgi:ribonuclease Z